MAEKAAKAKIPIPVIHTHTYAYTHTHTCKYIRISLVNASIPLLPPRAPAQNSKTR